jgi:uncharacterized membrane protein
MAHMRVNMTGDGRFYLVTWTITLIGILLLWSAGYARATMPSLQAFTDQLLLGWGVCNVVEGLIDHQILGIHHVKEVPNATAHNLTCLAVGGLLGMRIGWRFMRAGS